MDEDTAKALIDAVCAVTTDSQTLEIAEWVTMTVPGRKKASEYLHHYLDGTKSDKYVDIAELFRADPKLERIVREAVLKDLKASPPRTSGRVPLPQSAYSNDSAAQDWRYAIGSLVMDWKVVARIPGTKQTEVELAFRNEYRWHPKLPRISQCVHQAAQDLKVRGAQDFWIIGRPYRIKIVY